MNQFVEMFVVAAFAENFEFERVAFVDDEEMVVFLDNPHFDFLPNLDCYSTFGHPLFSCIPFYSSPNSILMHFLPCNLLKVEGTYR